MFAQMYSTSVSDGMRTHADPDVVRHSEDLISNGPML